MKPGEEFDNDPQLHSVLREWQIDAPLPSRFQEQVWRRIEQAETRSSSGSGLWPAVSRWLESALPSPKVALSYLAALLIAGVAAGAVAAQVKTSHLNAALSERYVQSIDPYHGGMPQP